MVCSLVSVVGFTTLLLSWAMVQAACPTDGRINCQYCWDSTSSSSLGVIASNYDNTGDSTGGVCHTDCDASLRKTVLSGGDVSDWAKWEIACDYDVTIESGDVYSFSTNPADVFITAQGSLTMEGTGEIQPQTIYVGPEATLSMQSEDATIGLRRATSRDKDPSDEIVVDGSLTGRDFNLRDAHLVIADGGSMILDRGVAAAAVDSAEFHGAKMTFQPGSTVTLGAVRWSSGGNTVPLDSEDGGSIGMEVNVLNHATFGWTVWDHSSDEEELVLHVHDGGSVRYQLVFPPGFSDPFAMDADIKVGGSVVFTSDSATLLSSDLDVDFQHEIILSGPTASISFADLEGARVISQDSVQGTGLLGGNSDLQCFGSAIIGEIYLVAGIIGVDPYSMDNENLPRSSGTLEMGDAPSCGYAALRIELTSEAAGFKVVLDKAGSGMVKLHNSTDWSGWNWEQDSLNVVGVFVESGVNAWDWDQYDGTYTAPVVDLGITLTDELLESVLGNWDASIESLTFCTARLVDMTEDSTSTVLGISFDRGFGCSPGANPWIWVMLGGGVVAVFAVLGLIVTWYNKQSNSPGRTPMTQARAAAASKAAKKKARTISETTEVNVGAMVLSGSDTGTGVAAFAKFCAGHPEIAHALINIDGPSKVKLPGSLAMMALGGGWSHAMLREVAEGHVDQVREGSELFSSSAVASTVVTRWLNLVGKEWAVEVLSVPYRALIRITSTVGDEAEKESLQVELNPNLVEDEYESKLLADSATRIETIVTNFAKAIAKGGTSKMSNEMKGGLGVVATAIRTSKFADNGPAVMGNILVTRFLVPMLVNPKEHGLPGPAPGEKTSRTLVLVSKVLQSAVSGTVLGLKEEFMGDVEGVRAEIEPLMAKFVKTLVKLKDSKASSQMRAADRPASDARAAAETAVYHFAQQHRSGVLAAMSDVTAVRDALARTIAARGSGGSDRKNRSPKKSRGNRSPKKGGRK